MQIKGYDMTVERRGDEYVASAPALPGCSVIADTQTEAAALLSEAIDAWLAMAEKMGREVPAAQKAFA